MTRFYVDSDNGNDANNGLGPDSAAGTDKPFLTIHQFTENARSAGDKLTCRRGTTARYDDGGQLDFTSDGTIIAPLIVEADYEGSSARGLHASDGWNGDSDVFDDSAQTYTMVFGSKVHTASATITGIVAGNVVYNDTDGDDPKEFSYEVASVSGTTLTLFLPWKGSTGATKTLKVMPAAPVWGTTTAFTNIISIIQDNFWKFQGIETSNTSFRIFDIDGQGFVSKDCVAQGDGTEHIVFNTVNRAQIIVLKIRATDTKSIIWANNDGVNAVMKDCLHEAENTTNDRTFFLNHPGLVRAEESEFTNNGGEVFSFGEIDFEGGFEAYFRNCIWDSVIDVDDDESSGSGSVFSEDHDGVLNKTKQYHAGKAVVSSDLMVESDTGTVRSGGSNISIKINPTTNISTTENALLKILEIPFFATTSSKQYEIFFRPDATANWTDDPTNLELWIELEAWGHASNNFRKITKSTGTIDMNGSTTFTALTVTVAPAQAGVAYLRVYYGKPKESGKTNVFFIDPIPVIT